MAWVKQCFNGLLRSGPIPHHLAFIMDGNRRFAERKTAGNLHEGHSKGFDKLLEALEWCLELGVGCVTVYAFSIDNFSRSKQEVDTLMSLAETKLTQLLTEEAIIKKHDLKVCILGNLKLLPEGVQEAAEKVHEATKSNKGPVLNICLAYLSSQEMAQSLQSAGRDDQLLTGFESNLYTKDCPAVDLMIRTSGESRLSDFLLWQSQHALLHFSDVLWPDFSFWHLLKAIVCYQNAYQTQQSLKEQSLGTNTHPKEETAAEQQAEIESREDASSAQPSYDSKDFSMRRFPDSSSDMADSVSELYTNQKAMQDLAESILNSDSNQSSTNASSAPSVADDSALASPTQATARLKEFLFEENTIKESVTSPPRILRAPGRRKGRLGQADRIDRSKKTQLLDDGDLDNGLFQKPEEPPVSRAEGLKRNGMRGGYDSMEDSDDDGGHVNGCPCCIVKFLPMHRICTDPTPAIRAIRDS